MHTIHALLDDLKLNKQHRRIVLAAGLGIFLNGYDLSIIAVALLLLKPAWHLSAVDTGLLGAATLAGAALGGLVGGRVADLFGRKVLYLIDVAAFFIAALLSGVAWDVTSLIIFRFLLGVGVGMDYPLSSSYIAEFMPKAQRGAGLSWAFTLWMIGAVVSAVVGLVLLHAGSNAWRWMFISGAFPALAVLWLRRNLPETPRWYIAHNRPEEAIQVLQNMSPEVDAQSLREALQGQTPELVPMRAWATLFAPQWLGRTLLVVIPWMMVDVSVYGLLVYLPILLGGFGIQSHTDALLWNVLFNLIALFGIASLALSTRRIGRVFPQIAGFALNAFFLGVLGLVALYMQPPIWLLIVTIFGYTFFNNFGPATTTWLLPAEIFPTDLRASAHGLATACSRVAAATSVFLLPSVQAAVGNGGLMLILTATALAGLLVTLLLGRDMEPGIRSLEEVSEIAERNIRVAVATAD